MPKRVRQVVGPTTLPGESETGMPKLSNPVKMVDFWMAAMEVAGADYAELTVK